MQLVSRVRGGGSGSAGGGSGEGFGEGTGELAGLVGDLVDGHGAEAGVVVSGLGQVVAVLWVHDD